ncbi:MAG: TetR/AcrR family transcriptional regulator [Acidimicrobiia bacterium]|nr:TetR/AcrR family transcriptional regulator [Acidimicrobiia bacterium]
MSTRTPLSEERIVAAAVDLADDGGLEAVSMRSVAAELDARAMSLYRHVDGKEALVAAMIDAVLGEIDLAEAEADWRTAVGRIARSAYEVIVRHPWMAQVWLAVRPGIHRIQLMEALLGAFRRGGCSRRLSHHALHAVQNHVLGHAITKVTFDGAIEDLEEEGRRFLEGLDEEAHPYVAEHVVEHLEPSDGDDRSDFDFGLDLLLDGVERLRRSG